MRLGALAPYESALRDGGTLDLLTDAGTLLPLAVQRYLADADPADETVLGRCRGPVLDVGCGPGRIVGALAERGIACLGVDIAELAVELTQQRGGAALSRDVFQRVPGEGRWPTVLVLDGNIGIGGSVDALLARLTSLLAATGRLVVEASTATAGVDEVHQVRFVQDGRPAGPQFDWAIVSVDALLARAARCGLAVRDQWSVAGRDFVEFDRATVTT